MPKIYELGRATDYWPDWGDYSDVLVHGLTSHRDREAGRLQLERTGPLAPSVSFPGLSDIVVTDDMKTRLTALIPELEFRPVDSRIVRVDWQEWDASADEPAEYPESGSPEDYVLGQDSDPALAAAMGPFWELVPDIDTGIEDDGGNLLMERYRGQHLVRADLLAGYNYISEPLRNALMALAPNEIDCQAARVRAGS